MSRVINYIIVLLFPLIAGSCASEVGRTTAGYSGDDLSATVEITRDRETKRAIIKISEDMKWKVYAGNTVESIEFTEPKTEGNERGEYELDVPEDRRSYFEVATSRGDAIMAERQLPLKGAFNFRDLGGFRTTDGRHVRWGKLFRADALSDLSDSDLRYLESIPLESIIDFRSEQEISQAPDRVPQTVKSLFAFTINPGNMVDMTILDAITPEVATTIMMQTYELLVSDKYVVEQYRRFFEVLQDDENIPNVFHCTAGKDRTGMAAMLVLSALGVDRKTIIDDYLMSNGYLSEKYADEISEQPHLKPIFGVHASYLNAGLARINKLYGSVENYLEDELDVDIEAFRKKFLY